MNIKTRLEKLEKIINPADKALESFYKNFGALRVVYTLSDISKEEQKKENQKTIDEYFDNMAKVLNITKEKAKELHYNATGYINIINWVD